MVLILSKDNELTTDEVIDWIHHYKQDFYRLNGEDIESFYSFSLSNNSNKSYKLNSLFEKFNKAEVIWFRRWHDFLDMNYFDSIKSKDAVRFNLHFRNEIFKLSGFFFKKFKTKKWIDFVWDVNVNKLVVLEIAIKLKLNVPDTIITSKKEEVLRFLSKNLLLITKPISEPLYLNYENYNFLTTTKSIDEDNIHLLPEVFFPSLFQKNITKKYEIRTFVLGDKLYSMAIFSQNDPKTKDDFRNYNTQKMNRYIPYSLPLDLEKKILKLMKQLNLKTGSIDLIKSLEDNLYYFLEVNPCGQFGMVSHPCNYFLEKEMAEFLITSIN